MSLTSWSCNFFCISEDKVTGEAIASDLKKMAVANPANGIAVSYAPEQGMPMTWGPKMTVNNCNQELRSKLCWLTKKYPGVGFIMNCHEKGGDSFWREEMLNGRVQFSPGRLAFDEPSPWLANKYRSKIEVPVYYDGGSIPAGTFAVVINAREDGVTLLIGKMKTPLSFTMGDFERFFEEVR